MFITSVGFVVCIAVCTSQCKWQIVAWLHVSCNILFRKPSSFWAQIGLTICSVESFFGISSITVISHQPWLPPHMIMMMMACGSGRRRCGIAARWKPGGESGLSGVSSSQASTQKCSLCLWTTIYLCSAKFFVVRRWQEESHWDVDRESMVTQQMESISLSWWWRKTSQVDTVTGADTKISSQENQKG